MTWHYFTWYELFPQIINMSMTASIIILAVLCVRLLLKNAPKIFSYALWAVVLFRLLCPVSFTLDFSLLNTFDVPVTESGHIEYVPMNIVHMEEPGVNTPIPVVNEVINRNLPQGSEQLVADPLEVPVSLATYIWFCGITALIFYSIIQYIKLRKRLVGAMPLRNNIFLADHIASPFVLGLLSPKIYLPSSMTEAEQEYVILHDGSVLYYHSDCGTINDNKTGRCIRLSETEQSGLNDILSKYVKLGSVEVPMEETASLELPNGATRLDEEELTWFGEQYFSDPCMSIFHTTNIFLKTDYASPKEINLFELFTSGLVFGGSSASDEEKILAKKLANAEGKDSISVSKITTSEMSDVFRVYPVIIFTQMCRNKDD